MINKLRSIFEALSQREKIIVVAVLLVTLGSSWNSFFYQPIVQRQKIFDQQLILFNNQTIAMKHQKTAINRQKTLGIDPNIDNKKKLDELTAQSAYQQKQISLFSYKNFISASSMAEVLSTVLTENKLLKLTHLETLPTTPLFEVKQHDQIIYNHELIITFYGKYFDTINYLKLLESLPWAIALGSIDYEVKDYPIAEITLHIVMLSLDKDLLDV